MAGGNKKEWKNVLEKISQRHVEQRYPLLDGEDMGELTYVKQNFNVEKLENPYILNPDDYKTQQEMFNAITHWWIFKKRRNEHTVKKRLPIAKRMAKHPIFPVNWKEIQKNQTIAYLDHREYYENAGKHAIRNEWDTVNMFAKAYGIDTSLWGYTPPSKPPAKIKIIPLPKTAHRIVHYKYSKDKYTNSLFQYILTHGFVIGWRPSEMVIQKVSSINIDDGYMIITETKKNSQLRQVFPEMDIMAKKQVKSFKNWIDYWRPKVENQYSKDFLYLQPNGKPYSVAYLRKKLTPMVKEVWSPFSLYTMRHWCATARLIKSKIETKNWDIWEVKDWHGHEKIETTDGYVRYAKKYYRNAPFDWINSILKYQKKLIEENGKNSIDAKNGEVLNKINPRNRLRTRRDSNPRSLA